MVKSNNNKSYNYKSLNYKSLVSKRVVRILSLKLTGKGEISIKILSKICKEYLIQKYEVNCTNWNRYKAIYSLYFNMFVNEGDFTLEQIQNKSFYKSEQWRLLRQKVFSVYGQSCMKCGYYSKSNHVDHIKPKTLHPKLALDFYNLQVLCERCNISKSNVDETDYRYGDTGMGYVFPWDR